MPWHARSLRLTVFPTPGANLDQAPKWEQLVGRAPEATFNQGGQVVEQGRLGPGLLALSRQPPLRLDLVYGAASGPDEDMSAPPVSYTHLTLPTICSV